MIRRAAVAALLLLGGAWRASAQTIQLRDAGPGEGPGVVRAALARPRVVIPPAPGAAVLPRGKEYTTSVIVLGREVQIDGRVRGDVVSIGGDVHIHPGALVQGAVISIGGGVYNSMLASTGPQISYRDFTYDIVPAPGGYVLDYRSLTYRPPVTAFSWPGFYGLGIPQYDRVDGLSFRVAALLSPDSGRTQLEPRVTYRSNLGAIDPSALVRLQVNRRTRLEGFAGRATFSNDTWIYSDLLNSASTFFLGTDSRNYFRADRAEVTAHRVWETRSVTLEPYVGARYERAWSVGHADSNGTGGPWSFLGRKSGEHMRRPNPAIDPGHIGSALLGTRLGWASNELRASLNAEEEIGWPTFRAGFAQTTLGASIEFPTFGVQSFRTEGHFVLTAPSAPRQRWAYVGGGGTNPLMDQLAQGGAELLYFDSRYDIPIERIVLPRDLGNPIVTLRHILAAAGPRSVPSIENAVGVRVSVSVLRAELLVDPAGKRGHFGFGVSFTR